MLAAAAIGTLAGAALLGGSGAVGAPADSGQTVDAAAGRGPADFEEPAGAPPPIAAFQRCMEDHGAVLPPTPPRDEGSATLPPPPGEEGPATLPAPPSRDASEPDGTALVLPADSGAREECSEELEPRPDDAVVRDRMERHRQCMHEHGIELPAPTVDESGISVRIDPKTVESPEFRAAAKECDPLLFGGPGGG